MAQLPIGLFLRQRLQEFDSEFELRKGTGFEQLFFKPMEFIVQPIQDEARQIFTAQSFLRILNTDNPDDFNEESVDSLASNIFVERRTGGRATGTARVFYNTPVNREFPANGATFVSSNGDTFVNPSPFRITANQMSAQLQNGLYFFDIQLQSEQTGDIQVGVNEIVNLLGDNEFVRIENSQPFNSGVPRETNTELIQRARNSIGVRDLVTGKGFNAILFQNFTSILQEVQPIGFQDKEMMRDIVFNTHVGGRVDGYTKTFSIKQGSSDFIGLLIDTTRQTFTSVNVSLDGTQEVSLNQPNIDRSNGKEPIVQEIKVSIAAKYLSPIDLSSPVDLSSAQYIRLGIDGDFLDIRVAGVVPSATSRNEIINLINEAFGKDVAFADGNSIRIQSPNKGLNSEVVITNPNVGNSAIKIIFDLNVNLAPHVFEGDGPVTFVEGVHYSIDDGFGTIQRIVGPTILSTQNTGETSSGSDIFTDNTTNQFLNVEERDIITITSGSDQGDYRILEKIDNNNLRLDAALTTDDTNIEYIIRRTGIKNGELVFVQYYFNPLSIDIGRLAVLDEFGRQRGIRPGREEQTITDLVFLRIRSIELIDPLTREPLGTVLDGTGGYGQGGYGLGGYGIGEGSEYRLVVDKPTARFSMFEESYIVIDSGFSGLSFRVNYDYVPEIESLHNFVRSEGNRVLDGDILMKHFLPAYVKGTIRYRVDPTDTSIPTNEDLEEQLANFIDRQIRAGQDLEYSDITQFILRKVDPFDKYTAFVEPFKLEAVIHNTDGTITKITGDSKLEVPTLDPFPKETPRPLSPRITHWVADDIQLERVNGTTL